MGFKVRHIETSKGTKSARAEQARRWCGGAPLTGKFNTRKQASEASREASERANGLKRSASSGQAQTSERGEPRGERASEWTQAADLKRQTSSGRRKRQTQAADLKRQTSGTNKRAARVRKPRSRGAKANATGQSPTIQRYEKIPIYANILRLFFHIFRDFFWWLRSAALQSLSRRSGVSWLRARCAARRQIAATGRVRFAICARSPSPPLGSFASSACRARSYKRTRL